MTVKDLIATLTTLPPETEVWYEDGNFGGRSEEFCLEDITIQDNLLLIRSPYWQDCNEC